MNVYGYARVSSKDQNEDLQIDALKNFGIASENIKDFLGTLIADLALQIMSAFAQIELDSIKRRQAEGIAAAKARGVKFGRPLKKLPDNYPEVRDAWKSGKISVRKAGKLLGINPQTFLRRVHAEES